MWGRDYDLYIKNCFYFIAMVLKNSSFPHVLRQDIKTLDKTLDEAFKTLEISGRNTRQSSELDPITRKCQL